MDLYSRDVLVDSKQEYTQRLVRSVKKGFLHYFHTLYFSSKEECESFHEDENCLFFLNDPNNTKVKKEKFVWANIWQIKKLCLENCLINPFVKTILFMI